MLHTVNQQNQANKVHVFFHNPNKSFKDIENAPITIERRLSDRFGGETPETQTVCKYGYIETPVWLDPSNPVDAEKIEYCRKYKANLQKRDPLGAALMHIIDPVNDAKADAEKNEKVLDVQFKITGLYKAKDYQKLGNVLRHFHANISMLDNNQVYNKLLDLAKTKYNEIEQTLSDDFNQLIFLAELAIEKQFFIKSDNGKVFYDAEVGNKIPIASNVEELAYWLQQNEQRREYLEVKLGAKTVERPALPSVSTAAPLETQDVEVEERIQLSPEEHRKVVIDKAIELGVIKTLDKGWFQIEEGQPNKRKADVIDFYSLNPLSFQGLEQLVAHVEKAHE